MENSEFRKEVLPSEVAATPWVNFSEFTYEALAARFSEVTIIVCNRAEVIKRDTDGMMPTRASLDDYFCERIRLRLPFDCRSSILASS